MEWKAGAPYGGIPPCPIACCLFSSAHGKATLKDGPGENETTVEVASQIKPGMMCPCCVPKPAVVGAIKGFSAKAPARFKKETYVGPKAMAR